MTVTIATTTTQRKKRDTHADKIVVCSIMSTRYYVRCFWHLMAAAEAAG